MFPVGNGTIFSLEDLDGRNQLWFVSEIGQEKIDPFSRKGATLHNNFTRAISKD